MPLPVSRPLAPARELRGFCISRVGKTEVPIYDRGTLGAGDHFNGPYDRHTILDAATAVTNGWTGMLHPEGTTTLTPASNDARAFLRLTMSLRSTDPGFSPRACQPRFSAWRNLDSSTRCVIRSPKRCRRRLRHGSRGLPYRASTADSPGAVPQPGSCYPGSTLGSASHTVINPPAKLIRLPPPQRGHRRTGSHRHGRGHRRSCQKPGRVLTGSPGNRRSRGSSYKPAGGSSDCRPR